MKVVFLASPPPPSPPPPTSWGGSFAPFQEGNHLSPSHFIISINQSTTYSGLAIRILLLLLRAGEGKGQVPSSKRVVGVGWGSALPAQKMFPSSISLGEGHSLWELFEWAKGEVCGEGGDCGHIHISASSSSSSSSSRPQLTLNPSINPDFFQRLGTYVHIIAVVWYGYVCM